MFICIVGMIEKNSIQGCLDYFNTLSVHLKQESDKFESSHQLTQASSKRKIRKRRIRTQHSAVPEIHKLKPTRHLSLIDKQTRQPVKSPLITPSTPVRSKSFSQGENAAPVAEMFQYHIHAVSLEIVRYDSSLNGWYGICFCSWQISRVSLAHHILLHVNAGNLTFAISIQVIQDFNCI